MLINIIIIMCDFSSVYTPYRCLQAFVVQIIRGEKR